MPGVIAGSGGVKALGAARTGMHVVGVAGPSDAGKTGLVERLVPAVAGPGRVATVKSIHHDVEPDDPGADTHRHRTAGAASATGVTPSLTFEVRAGGKGSRDDPTAGARALEAVLSARATDGMAVTLVEGFSQARLPTVLVGDITAGDVAGPVIARVGDDAMAGIVDAIHRPREFHTPTSLLDRLDDAAVGVIAATIPIERPVPWLDGDDSLGELSSHIGERDGVTGVDGGRRPSVLPAPSHAEALLAIAARDRAAARRGLDEARDGLLERGADRVEVRVVA